ncbi:hypothetical protein D3C85_15910 [compost metagenome]
MLTLYTIAIPQWRKAKELGIELFDITVKSGFEPFAPYKDVLYAYKRGEVDDDQYTEIYLKKLREHFRASPEDFEDFLKREGKFAVACYCKAGKFCHRHIFITFVLELAEDNGYDVEVVSEIL